ncbi:MAG: hypothetical protein JXO72_16435 [Vicinamibacteria bacterium]|nr:hypothetical protein [Vicinamibacteria bacterium]
MAKDHAGCCELCGHEAPRTKMAQHLAACCPKHDKGAKPGRIVQLHVDAVGMPEYWLYLEGRDDATLEQLDSLLRHAWLECCGHMSAFFRDRTEIGKQATLGSLASKGVAFQYEYDFGSTTALKGKVLGYRKGSIGRQVVRLLARNKPPRLVCAACGAPATQICSYCIHSGACLFCDAHAAEHPCAEEEALLPTVNSPRMGVCAYRG